MSVCVVVSVGVVVVAVMVSAWVKVMVVVPVCMAVVVMVSVGVVVVICQYASRGVVCWGGVGSGVDSNIVSKAGIVGISCVSSLGGDDISDSGSVSGSRCSVSSGSKSYVSVLLLSYSGSLMISMISFESFPIPFHDK